MAHTVDSISIRGLRKAHLHQLAAYIRERDREGWYYGPLDHFRGVTQMPNIPRPAVPGNYFYT